MITNEAKVSCEKIVLCTNGFENFYIHDTKDIDIDGKFHHVVQGAVGYMTGFVSEHPEKYMANYYYDTGKIRGNDPFSSDPYFYVTKEILITMLVCFNSQQSVVQKCDWIIERYIIENLKQPTNYRMLVYDSAEQYFDMTDTEHRFFWHGLMGYTTSGVRLVGWNLLNQDFSIILGVMGLVFCRVLWVLENSETCEW